MLLNKSLVITSSIAAMAFTLLAACPQTLEAQLFPRLFQRRCCPVVHHHSAPVCYNGSPYNTSYGTDMYGTSFQGNGYAIDSGTQSDWPMSNQSFGDYYAYGDNLYENTVYTSGQNESGQMNGQNQHSQYDNNMTTDGSMYDSPMPPVENQSRVSGQQNETAGGSAYVGSPQDNPNNTGRSRQDSPQSMNQEEEQQQALTSFYAGKFYLANHCAVEMAKLAETKSSNDDVRQFASKLIEEHRSLNEQLQKLAPNEVVSAFPVSSEEGLARDDQNSTDDDSTRTYTGRVNYDQSSNPIVQKMSEVEKQAAENALESATQMLNRYSGQDFDMAFVGMQIAKHTELLAQLNAMKDIGSDEFQQIVSSAITNVEAHAEKARELSAQLDDDGSVQSDDWNDEVVDGADSNEDDQR